MQFRLSARLARTLVTLIVSAILMYNLLLLRADAVKNERELAFNLTAVSWKISETIFEAKRLEVDLHNYYSGLASRDDVILQNELLWSRLGVLQDENLPLHNGIVAAISNMHQTLVDWEVRIYDAEHFPTQSALDLSEVLSGQTAFLRSLWISDFLADRDAMLAAGMLTQNRNHEYLANLLVLGMIFYMIAELYWASRAQQREVKLRKAATAANEAKSAFLANVSHEIRTPLNGVLGMAQELSDSPLTEDQNERRCCMELALPTICPYP